MIAEKRFTRTLQALGSFPILVVILIGFFLLWMSIPVLKTQGLSFFGSLEWDPVHHEYGVLSFLWGTLWSSLLALLLAVPVSIGSALFLTESAPTKISRWLQFLIEMLAAIPSVVYGLWGIFVLVPFLRLNVQTFLSDHFGFLPFFSGPPYGIGMMAAAVILAIMITPTITSLAREVFQTSDRSLKEAALALGATPWEAIHWGILRENRSGILGAVLLGFGRAFGETMAVTMLIGNRNQISLSLFAPGQTMASVIANEYAEASSHEHVAALSAVGLTLFIVSILIQRISKLKVNKK